MSLLPSPSKIQLNVKYYFKIVFDEFIKDNEGKKYIKWNAFHV